MLNNIKLGQYLHGNSWYYRLDPRAKLIMSVLFIVTIFLATNWVTYLGATIFTLAIVLTSRVSLKFFFRSIKPIFFLMLLTFFMNLFFNKTGKSFSPIYIKINQIMAGTFAIILALLIILRLSKVIKKHISGKIFKFSTLLIIIMNLVLVYLFSFEQYTWSFKWIVYKNAVINGGFIVLRLVLIISFSSLLTFTTKPTDLTLAIEKVLGPLKLIKLPVSELALMISISLRFIPTLLEETQKILKAQTSRGADFTEGNLKDKVVQIISLLIPMFIISFRRAEDLANAMEARGYIPGKKRTSLKELKWQYRDSLYSFSFVVLTLFLIYYR